jgi:hypothetical protein
MRNGSCSRPVDLASSAITAVFESIEIPAACGQSAHAAGVALREVPLVGDPVYVLPSARLPRMQAPSLHQSGNGASS